MQIERLSEENLGSFVQLVNELWEDTDFDEEYAYYQTLIGSESEVCYAAKHLDNYVAFAHATIRTDYVEGADQLPVAYLEGIYVQPTFQNRGVAKKLIQEIENWAKQKGLKQLASDTPISNTESIKFHEKVGFQEVERIVCMIKNLD